MNKVIRSKKATGLINLNRKGRQWLSHFFYHKSYKKWTHKLCSVEDPNEFCLDPEFVGWVRYFLKNVNFSKKTGTYLPATGTYLFKLLDLFLVL